MKDLSCDDVFSKLKNMTILYVEDEEDIRVNFVRILMRRSDKVYTAENGLDGIEKFKEHKPDIILTDIQMPGMDGLSMCEEIRKYNRDIPIIITSAFDVGLSAERVKNINLTGYLKKPIDRQELIQCLSDGVASIISNKG